MNEPQRGLSTVITALSKLPGVHLALIANPENATVKALQIEASAVADRFHVIPYVTNSELVSFLSTANIGLIPLHHKLNHEISLITKFGEYMQAKLPIIVSDVKTMAAEVRRLKNGEVFIAENVKGLVSMGEVKDIIANDFRNINGGYIVLDPKVLHAGNYGVAQTRERIIFIGIRKDLLSQTIIKKIQSGKISLYPEPTHDYKTNFVTVSDAIFDLCEPEQSKDLSHQKYSKAKWYGKHCQGQTEINPNKLSPTIRAEHHGNIEFRRLAKENGGIIESEFNLPQRRLSVRECARIQTFPDDYEFVTDKIGASEAYKLVGNAVPPLLGYHIAKQLEAVWSSIFVEQTDKTESSLKEVA